MNFIIEKIKEDCRQNLYNLKKIELGKSNLADQLKNTIKAADDGSYMLGGVKANDMTQDMIDTLFDLTIVIHENDWFGKRKKPRDREEVQEWVAKQLAEAQGIYTTPCGMSWGVLTTKERFDEYWKENGKLDK